MNDISFSTFTESDKQHFFILLLYAVNIDDDISKNEARNIMRFAKLLKKSKEEALHFINEIKKRIVLEGDPDSLVYLACQHFSAGGNLVTNAVFECLVTLCYADGVFHPKEQEFIRTIGGAFHLSDNTYNTIIKNVEKDFKEMENDYRLSENAMKMPNNHASKIFSGLLKSLQK